MSERIAYYQLSDKEKVALGCAIVFPHRALKDVLPELFNTSWTSTLYKRHNEGREALRRRGLLDKNGNPTDLAYGILPSDILGNIVQRLNREIKSEYEKRSELDLKMRELEQECRNLKTENEKLVKVQERFKSIAEIIETFSFLGVNENWISVLICSNLVEQAMKKKLEELGCAIETDTYPSFNDIKQALGNALKEKENRRLEALFEPRELWRIRNKMDHEGHRLRFNRAQTDAIFVMTKEIIDQIWRSK